MLNNKMMPIHDRLSPDLVATIRAGILDKVIPVDVDNWSYDEVFDELIDPYGNPDLASRLSSIQRSMTNDSSFEKYNTLLAAGFDDDFARQVAGLVYPFEASEIQFLQTAHSKDDLLDKLSASRPFLADLIRSLEYNVSNSKFVLSRLLAHGIPMNLVNAYLIYRSGRPRTTMAGMTIVSPVDWETELNAVKLFASDDPVLIPSDWMNKLVEVHQSSLFPVIRYGAGMSKGTYTKTYGANATESFCGTFYYYEPDSTIFLRARDILVCPNKLCAMAYLVGVSETARMFDRDIKDGNQTYRRTPVRDILDADSWDQLITEMVVGNFDFTQHRETMYALEDRFDQPLCNASRGRFELVVLTSMTGENRVVTEILDTRSRQLSFGMLRSIDARDIQLLHTPFKA